MRVGDELGQFQALVGETLGTVLGMDVVASDGALLGRIVGEALGTVLGMDVGSTDGALLG